MGLLRMLILGCRSICWSAAALWLIALPHIRPQASASQFPRQITSAPDQSPWMTSYWDLGQNIKIDQINEHLEKATDANIAKLQDQNLQLARELSDLEARSSVWFSILSAATLGALGLAMNNFLKIKGKP